MVSDVQLLDINHPITDKIVDKEWYVFFQNSTALLNLVSKGILTTNDHTALINIGTTTHPAIDAHIASSNIHFLKNSISHSVLQDLLADDHTQYPNLSGVRPFTGTIGGITPTLDAHLTTKKYVDDAVEVENLWDRAGTTLNPHNAGDDISTTGDALADTFISDEMSLRFDGTDTILKTADSVSTILHLKGADFPAFNATHKISPMFEGVKEPNNKTLWFKQSGGSARVNKIGFGDDGSNEESFFYETGSGVTNQGNSPNMNVRFIRAGAGGIAANFFSLSAHSTTSGLDGDLGFMGILGGLGTAPEAPSSIYIYMSADITQSWSDAFLKIDKRNRFGLGLDATQERPDTVLHARQTADNLGFKLEGYDDLATSAYQVYWDSAGVLNSTSTSSQFNILDYDLVIKSDSHSFKAGAGEEFTFGYDGFDGNIATTSGDINLSPARSTTIGDGGITDYVEVSNTGDMVFKGGAGLAFGSMWVDDNVTATVITGSGSANKVQYTNFANNGCTNNTTPDFTNDHITIDNAGCYNVSVKITADSIAGLGSQFSFDIYVNNGATAKLNLHAHRDFGGGGGEVGSIAIVGMADFDLNDTVELWVHNETNTQNIVLSDVELSLSQVGG